MFGWLSRKKTHTIENPYLDLVEQVMDKGVVSVNQRTGVETRRVIGPQYEFDLSKGWPLIAERKVPYKSMFAEMLWFLFGGTNAIVLNRMGSRVWDEWAISEHQAREAIRKLGLVSDDEEIGFRDLHPYAVKNDTLRHLDTQFAPGYLGPIYNQMWRRWPGAQSGTTIDQITEVFRMLKTYPTSRRLIVTGWNPTFLPDETKSPQQNVMDGKQALPPCHTLYQFFAEETPLLDRCKLLYESAPAHLDHFLAETGLYEAHRYLSEGQFRAFHRRASVRPYTDFSQLPETYFPNGQKTAVLDYANAYIATSMFVPKYRLSMKLYARSQDLPLGTVFNQAMYSALVIMFARHLKMTPHKYIHTIGDAHIYGNQYDAVEKLLARKRRPFPSLHIENCNGNVPLNHTVSDFVVNNYNPDTPIKFPITV